MWYSAEALELFNWKIFEDLHWSCELQILHLVHLFRDKWEVYRQWF